MLVFDVKKYNRPDQNWTLQVGIVKNVCGILDNKTVRPFSTFACTRFH